MGGKKQPLQEIMLGKLDRYMQKNQTGIFSHTMHKKKIQNGLKTNVRSETMKVLL